MNEKIMIRTVDPAEALHNVGNSLTSPTTGNFVNPGTPAAPFVGMDDRKTGMVSKTSTEGIRNHMTGDNRITQNPTSSYQG